MNATKNHLVRHVGHPLVGVGVAIYGIAYAIFGIIMLIGKKAFGGGDHLSFTDKMMLCAFAMLALALLAKDFGMLRCFIACMSALALFLLLFLGGSIAEHVAERKERHRPLKTRT